MTISYLTADIMLAIVLFIQFQSVMSNWPAAVPIHFQNERSSPRYNDRIIPELSENDLERLNKSQLNSTFKRTPYITLGLANEVLCWDNSEDDLFCEPKHGIEGISVIINENCSTLPVLPPYQVKNDTFANILNFSSSILDSLIFLINYDIIGYTPYDSECAQLNAQLTDYLLSDLNIVGPDKSIQTSVKLGVEYNQKVLQGCEDRKFGILKYMDAVILRIDISPKDTVFSYGSFTDKIAFYVETNREMVQRYNKNCTLLVRINYLKTRGFSNDAHVRLQGIVLQYMESWLEETGDNHVVIISPVAENNLFQETKQVFRERVSPLYKNSVMTALVSNFARRNCVFHCNIQRTMDKVSSVFDTIVHFGYVHNSICAFRSKCAQDSDQDMNDLICNGIKSSSLILDKYKEGDEEQATYIQQILNQADALKIHTVYFWNEYSSWNTSKWSDIVKILGSKNIRIGCYVSWVAAATYDPRGVSAEVISKLCGPLLNVSAEVVFYIYLFHDQQELLPIVLYNINRVQNEFAVINPGKTLIPYIELEEIREENDRIDEEDFNLKRSYTDVKGLYCDKHIKRVNENYNGILSVAYANNWNKLFLGSVIGLSFVRPETGWWRRVEISTELNRSVADFLLLIRSTNERDGEVWKLQGTFPCIRWNEIAQDIGVVFLDGGFSGTVLNMNLRLNYSLTIEELETLVLVGLGKFPHLELITHNQKDLFDATTVLSNIALKHDIQSTLSSTLAYIEIPCTSQTKAYNQHPNMTTGAPIAAHFSGWEEQFSEKYLLKCLNAVFGNKFALQKIKFGLTVQNCAHEINLNLSRLRSLVFIEKADYLVCNVEPVSPNMFNVGSMQKYLDNLFYIKTYTEKFLFAGKIYNRNFQVIFRINLISKEKEHLTNRMDTEEFLKFIDNVNQHGVAYKINYFVVAAFGRNSMAGETRTSWWRLDNYTDLTNLSVYVDRENEHFGRPATPIIKLPPRFRAKETIVNHFNVVLAVVIPVVLLGLLVAIFTLYFYNNSFRKRYLTEKEVIGFYNGQELSSDILDSKDAKWLQRKFPRDFEIPKSSIEIGNIIGRGEFGVVYRGILSGELPVAIKKPGLGSGREMFRSFLAEVKVLFYIGNHQNVVGFVGAYTKEIRRGKIYIVMEFCKKGSLQNYLRDKQSGRNFAVDLYQLYRFSEHIASGMAYIGEKGVVHGDLSCRNVLLTSELICKISDFGLSRRLYEINEYVKKGAEPLPWKWMAPESLKNKIFTTKSDMWSYGITLWEIYSLGAMPYPGLVWSTDFVTELEDGMRMQKPKYSTDEKYGKLVACWNLIAKERPSFEQLVEYFATLKDKEYEVV